MRISLECAFYILLFLVLADISLLIAMAVSGVCYRLSLRRRKHVRDFLLYEMSNVPDAEKVRFIKTHRRLCVEEYIDLSQRHIINMGKVDQICGYFRDLGFVSIYMRQLGSVYKLRRIKAALSLGYIGGERVRKALEQALSAEKTYSGRIYIAYALSLIRDRESLPFLVNSLFHTPVRYQQKIYCLISEYGKDFYDYIPTIRNRTEPEIRLLIIHFASVYIASDLKDYLLECSRLSDKTIVYAALRSLSVFYFNELDNAAFLESEDITVRKIAIEGISKVVSPVTVEKLISYLSDFETRDYCVTALITVTQSNPAYLNIVAKYFYRVRDDRIKTALANVLATRIEYFLAKLLSPEKNLVRKLITYVFKSGGRNGIVGFLNHNSNIEIENEILSAIRPCLASCSIAENDVIYSLDDRILAKLSIKPPTVVPSHMKQFFERDKSVILFMVLVCVGLFFPLLFYLRHAYDPEVVSWSSALSAYVIDFNYYLIYYSVSINVISIIILCFSVVGSIRQAQRWRLKKMAMLFKNALLPSVSIIAPAYCEENGIVESINSLLTLQYPDYDLIIVNDGSTDNTLLRVIEYFKLERVDLFVDPMLETQPVRGLYKNKSIPKLTVIDKVNGGKADALNVGINFSRKDYFCGIDSDSVLEPLALMKAVSPLLDFEEELIASGGNIIPSNGVKIDRGMIDEKKIPSRSVARFQMVEYMRAFMAGRIGWDYIRSLAIISGAFGVFNRQRVIDIGGYLSEKSAYHKNTVGEDMELVVRLTRQMHERRGPNRITYAFNANCWTEVPEDMKILYRQRDRWQRALIDVLVFHRRILFNPAYRQMGLVAFPYFFLFEFVGPLIEAKGYIMVLVAALLGLLNIKLALLLFISSVMLGTLISIMSVFIAGLAPSMFSLRETLALIWYAVIENFGFRQLMSFLRVCGFFNALRGHNQWGIMERRNLNPDADRQTA